MLLYITCTADIWRSHCIKYTFLECLLNCAVDFVMFKEFKVVLYLRNDCIHNHIALTNRVCVVLK